MKIPANFKKIPVALAKLLNVPTTRYIDTQNYSVWRANTKNSLIISFDRVLTQSDVYQYVDKSTLREYV